jgi:hypothetical protein
MSKLRQARTIVPALFFAVLVLGCSQSDQQPLAEVEGTLKWRQQPLANVVVAFIPETGEQLGQRSTGITDENGHYVLKTDDGRPGTTVGKHRVVLTVPRNEKRRSKGEDPDPSLPEETTQTEQISDLYTTANTTPLHREVKEGKQVIDLLID